MNRSYSLGSWRLTVIFFCQCRLIQVIFKYLNRFPKSFAPCIKLLLVFWYCYKSSFNGTRFRSKNVTGSLHSWVWNQLRGKKFLAVLLSPKEQCLNSAPKFDCCYVTWLRICHLFTVLTSVILKSLIMRSRTYIGLVGISHLKEHVNLSIFAISDFRFLYLTGSSGLEFQPML